MKKEKVKCSECGIFLTNPISREKKLCSEHGGGKCYVQPLMRGFKRV